jgi:hypothetical protein
MAGLLSLAGLKAEASNGKGNKIAHAAAKMAEQLRKSTMFVPFQAIRRALGLKLQKL